MTRRRGLLIVLGLALAVGVYRWYAAGPPPPDPPPVPETVPDPEVRAALTAAREEVLKDPRSGQAWGMLGKVFRAHGLDPESNACFGVAARFDPTNPRWPYLIGLHALKFDPDNALPPLRTAHQLATTPEHRSAIRLRLAEALQEFGQFDEASGLFAEELKANPDDPRAHFGLGGIAAARGDLGGAIPHLERAAGSPFARRKAAVLLAAAYRQRGDPDRASRTGAEAARGPADYPWPDPFVSEYGATEAGLTAKWRRVEELRAAGRVSEAVAVLDEIARTAPDSRCFLLLGTLLGELGDHAAAEAALRSAVVLNPDHAVAHYQLGSALYNQASARWNRGDRGEAMEKQFDAAVREFRRATELNPGLELAHLATASALQFRRRLPEAEAAAREAVLIAPQLSAAHRTLGEVLLEEGRPADAIPHLEEAVRLGPREPRAAALLAKAKAAGKK